MTVTKQFF